MKTSSLLTLALVLMAGFSPRGEAQSADHFPSSTIKVMVPFAPGGIVDGLARIIAQRMSENLK